MEDKKNKNAEELTKKIYQLENLMEYEKAKIKKIDELQEQITSLTKSLNICIALLAKSIKGPTTNNIFNDMYDNNRLTYSNILSELDENIDLTKKNINQHINEKENLVKELSEQLKQEEKE